MHLLWPLEKEKEKSIDWWPIVKKKKKQKAK